MYSNIKFAYVGTYIQVVIYWLSEHNNRDFFFLVIILHILIWKTKYLLGFFLFRLL